MNKAKLLKERPNTSKAKREHTTEITITEVKTEVEEETEVEEVAEEATKEITEETITIKKRHNKKLALKLT